ncbi:tyrosine-type recombinase/integrase [Paraburkholderia sp. BR14320]|uniref:tyrosine-type recombinase/integrase n=1 Tax=unclassified Paraburkholderia TaxID=2615204 RepID=UPI0034CE5EE2
MAHARGSLYRYAGVRLAELVWSEADGLPRLEVDSQDQWTLHVQGKGGKRRSVPLPSVCVPALRAYRLARASPACPSPFERVALIHSEKRDALGHSGLYDEVKAGLLAAETRVTPRDLETLTLLRAASTHWLRHGYARALVVDHAVPLPVAQTLLGHASVQTTAAYARTDLTQTRAFVEGSFPDEAQPVAEKRRKASALPHHGRLSVTDLPMLVTAPFGHCCRSCVDADMSAYGCSPIFPKGAPTNDS